MAQIVDIDNDDTIEKADIDAIIDKESPCFIIPVFFISTKTVSYTHLDVYKRQGSRLAQG